MPKTKTADHLKKLRKKKRKDRNATALSRSLLAKVLKEQRERRGFTFTDMTTRTGMDPSNYRKIEEGKIDPRLSTWVRILKGLGLCVKLQRIRK